MLPALRNALDVLARAHEARVSNLERLYGAVAALEAHMMEHAEPDDEVAVGPDVWRVVDVSTSASPDRRLRLVYVEQQVGFSGLERLTFLTPYGRAHTGAEQPDPEIVLRFALGAPAIIRAFAALHRRRSRELEGARERLGAPELLEQPDDGAGGDAA